MKLIMGRCVYCGRPAGLLRRKHAECFERHQRASSMIPGFFSKLLESPLAPDRFCQLLQGAAEVSFLKPDELRKLCSDGIKNLLTTVLEQRFISSGEEERISEIVDKLENVLSCSLELDDTLVKISMLSELREGKTPDRVVISGPMPIELRRGESIIWIFNRASAYRHASASGGAPNEDASTTTIPVPVVENKYYPLNFSKTKLHSKVQATVNRTGDLILTNYNIYLLSTDGRPVRIPIARISEIQSFMDSVSIHPSRGESRSWAFVIDDPWFAVNAIACLVPRSGERTQISRSYEIASQGEPG